MRELTMILPDLRALQINCYVNLLPLLQSAMPVADAVELECMVLHAEKMCVSACSSSLSTGRTWADENMDLAHKLTHLGSRHLCRCSHRLSRKACYFLEFANRFAVVRYADLLHAWLFTQAWQQQQ